MCNYVLFSILRFIEQKQSQFMILKGERNNKTTSLYHVFI